MKSEELAFLHRISDVPTNTVFIMYSWENGFFVSEFVKCKKVNVQLSC